MLSAPDVAGKSKDKNYEPKGWEYLLSAKSYIEFQSSLVSDPFGSLSGANVYDKPSRGPMAINLDNLSGLTKPLPYILPVS